MKTFVKALVFASITILSTSMPALTQVEQRELNMQLYKEVSGRYTPSDLHVTRLKELIKQGADVNFHNPDGNSKTPLHAAVDNQNIAGVKVLLENGAQVTASDNNKATPLHIACTEHEEEVVKLLLREKDIDINNSDPGYTPLYAAAFITGPIVVDLLMQHGASPNIAASNGETPLSFVQKYSKLLQPLISGGYPPEGREEAEKHFSLIQTLLEAKEK
ncbi:ankyrin repeat domain-containing protein [Candidatus Babeliales bacterium]|nr:ankyrin repeat domain-containing protein [Candidatus Babeliales bacterium]